MNAVEFLNTQADNGTLVNHTLESAYDLYLTQTEEPSSSAFFKAKFNAKMRLLDKVVIVTSNAVEEKVEISTEPTIYVETDKEYNSRVAEIEGETEVIDDEVDFSEVDVDVLDEDTNVITEEESVVYDEEIDFYNVTKEQVAKMSNEDYDKYENFIKSRSGISIESIQKKPCPTADMIAKHMENASTNYYEDEEVEERVEYETTRVRVFDDEVKENGLEITNYRDGKDLPDLPGLIPTGTIFDRIICDRVTSDEEKSIIPSSQWERGGFTRKCCDVVAGAAGSGKTFSRAMLACMAKQINPSLRIGFISAEMREVEWVKEVKSAPILADLEIVYMLKYVGQSNYEDIFYEAISLFDIVVVDSFPAIISHIKMSPKERRTDKAITFDLIREINLSVDKYNYNMQLINQATKDGNYKGGTELPHMMSSQSFVKVDGQKRYMEFEKNRNNGNTIKRKVYFTKNTTTGLLEFDSDIYVSTYETKEDVKQSIAEFFKTVQERVEVNGEEEESSIINSNNEDLVEDQLDTESIIEQEELHTINL